MKNYKLTDKNSDNGLAIIQITEGEFKNVEFAFGKITFNEDDEEDNCKVIFDFAVTTPPKEKTCQEAEDMLELQDTIGKILINILEEQAKNTLEEQVKNEQQPNTPNP
tara:strand:+ start:711 stop:1034 length:324 start_codon:yes stop_codon:yes gene_type:complete